MAGNTYYSTGTASVANGGTTVTGSGTAWASVVQAGDLFLDPAQGLVAMITAVASNTSITIDAWPGTTISGAAYKIVFASDAIRQSERARRYLEIASQIANTGIGIDAFGDFTDRATYNTEATGFAFLSFDGDGASITDPVIFLKNSSTSADWSAAVEITGPQGDQGEAGLIGVWEGPWLTATAYAVGDAVSQGGSSYICLEAHTSGTFSTDLAASKWEIVAQKGDQGDPGTSFIWRGAYSGATAYAANDVVSNQSASWIALGATTGNAPPTLPTTSNAYWQLMAAKGTDGTNGTNGVDGKFSGTEIVKTSAYTAVAADVGKTIILNKATADTLSFDAAATLGSTWMLMVKNIGAGTWTLDPNGAEQIDGVATIALASGQSLAVASNGTALRSYFLSNSGAPYAAPTSSVAAAITLLEATNNGTNKITLSAPSSLAADRAIALPDKAGTVALIEDAADQAAMEAASSTTSFVVPARQQHHPSAAKCWLMATVSGGVPSIEGSYNITSISDDAVGILGVTIGTDFASASWAGFVSAKQAGTSLGQYVNAQTAGTIQCVAFEPATGSTRDPSAWYVAGFGDQ